ncbi:MAG: DUF1385 domain-containing protein [Clostridia bacterium]|nr:DUF1385 domain-containing protein [Clostridia bacterium]
MSKKEKEAPSCRLGKVGGQAVLEGVMMRSGSNVALAVRKDDGTIAVDRSQYVSAQKRHKVLGFPIVRGIVNFVEMLSLSYKTLMRSADMLGLEDELAEGEGSEEEKEKKKAKAKKTIHATEVVSLILGFLLAAALFVVLPVYAAKLINILTPSVDLDSLFAVTSLIEGAVRIAIFLLYLSLVSLIPDMRRTFEYHGAEHKSVFCYEKGLDLTPENAARCSRFHPRCGTSFIFVLLIISILVGAFIPGTLPKLARIGVKFLLVPVIVGIGYEFIRYAGRHDNAVVRVLSAPGLLMQRITTKEPDEKQLTVALTALKAAMPDEFPDTAKETLFAPDGSVIPPETPDEAETEPDGPESAPEKS